MPLPAFFRAFLAALLLATLTACGGTGPNTAPLASATPDDALPAASFAQAGLDPAVWTAVLRDLEERHMLVDQIGLMVDGKLLATRHYGEHSETTLHDLRSATKSVTSLLVGIAVDRGLISSIDAPVDGWFPELAPHPSRAAWRPLTLRDLLTMRSGLDCDDWQDSAGNEERMYLTRDWIRFFYGIPARQAPGGDFSYCTAGVVVLGEIVARAARQSLPDFARHALFEPLGIRNAVWADAGSGITDAGGHLRLSLSALLKLGELTRSGGLWQGRRIVSDAWVAQSIHSAGAMTPGGPLKSHMGWLWWLEPVRDGQARSWQARGNGGQLIIVAPEFRLVMAVTGRAWNEPPQMQWAPFGLLERWLFPALRGASPSGTPPTALPNAPPFTPG
ncbi:MAG: serine hydrolase [Ramlibacter sp.]|nr:serine hydrolase [Ramlibacter sp.]